MPRLSCHVLQGVVNAQPRNRALAPEMHLPQIVADLNHRRKIAEKVLSVNQRAFNQRILREAENP